MNISQTRAGQKNGVLLQHIKGSNLAIVFNQIMGGERITRAEIGRRAHIDPAAVTSFVRELISYNLVVEIGTATLEAAGRRPTILRVNPEGGYCYSVELQPDGFILAVYDVICRQIWSRKYIDDYRDIAGGIITALMTIPIRADLEGRHCLGISVNFSGIFKVETGETLSTLLPIAGRTDLFQRLDEYFDNRPVIIRNISETPAYAEHQYGIGRGVSDLVFIGINEGIGAGIIIGGRILSSSQGFCNELGHMTIDVNGPKCVCGANGCFQVMCNTVTICRSVNEALEQGRESSLRAAFQKEGFVGLPMIGQALSEGDALAAEALERFAVQIAHAVNGVYNILHPELIVIGGEITALGPRFLERVREHLAPMRLMVGEAGCRVEFSAIEYNNSVILGGAKYLLDSVLSDGDFFTRLAQEETPAKRVF